MADDEIKTIGSPVRDMTSLQRALRDRAIDLGICFEGLDAQCQFADRYAAKLLAPDPPRHLGAQSLGPLLACLGAQLFLAERPDALELYTSRVPRLRLNRRGAGGRVLADKKRRGKRHSLSGNSLWGQQMRAVQLMETTKQQRSMIARYAATARWAAVRKAGLVAKATPEHRARPTRRRNGGRSCE